MMFAVIVASTFEKPVNTAEDLLQSGNCPFTEILKVVSAVNTLVLFFAPAVLIFGLCTRTGCALVLIVGSSCANVWPKQFGQLTQLCSRQLAQLCYFLGN